MNELSPSMSSCPGRRPSDPPERPREGVPVIACDVVVAGTGADRVVSLQATNHIVSAEPDNHVVSSRAVQGVVPFSADDCWRLPEARRDSLRGWGRNGERADQSGRWLPLRQWSNGSWLISWRSPFRLPMLPMSRTAEKGSRFGWGRSFATAQPRDGPSSRRGRPYRDPAAGVPTTRRARASADAQRGFRPAHQGDLPTRRGTPPPPPRSTTRPCAVSCPDGSGLAGQPRPVGARRSPGSRGLFCGCSPPAAARSKPSSTAPGRPVPPPPNVPA